TLPRYMPVTCPGARHLVVHAVGALLDLVTARLPRPAGCDVAHHPADARAWLEAAPADSADVIVADVFGGSRVPAHLTTAAYADEVARVLREGGVYVANLADGAPFDFLRSQLATFATCFEELALVAERGAPRGRRLGHALLPAAHRRLPPAALGRR